MKTKYNHSLYIPKDNFSLLLPKYIIMWCFPIINDYIWSYHYRQQIQKKYENELSDIDSKDSIEKSQLFGYICKDIFSPVAEE